MRGVSSKKNVQLRKLSRAGAQHRTRTQITHQTSNIKHHSLPVALTIAGSDSSAGAGIQADLKTFGAFGVYGVSAITCVVAEIPGKVSRIEPVSPDMVHEQIKVLVDNFPVAAIKTGLLCSAEIVSTIARLLRGTAVSAVKRAGVPPALVVDPVIIATTGDQLLEPNAVELYENELFPLATLLTPNLLEAEKFIGQPIRDLKAMRRAGTALAKKYGVPILLKGGHLAGNRAIDLLFAGGKITEFGAPFVGGVATHGTGCTYSAAITAGLASGLPLERAIRRAKKFVTASIRNHLRWTSRSGSAIHALKH